MMKKDIQRRNSARRTEESREKNGVDKELKKQREAYQKNKANKQESQRAYDKSHREEKQKYQRKYDQSHREEKKEYYELNREVLSKASRDRAQEKKEG